MDNIIELFNIPNIQVEIPTVWLLKNSMGYDYHNAHLMIRFLAIENYYKKNDIGWQLYNKMQKNRVQFKSIIPREKADNQTAFEELIKSFEENGYLKQYPVSINSQFQIIDGSHRLVLALYMRLARIPITITKSSYCDDPNYSLEWFKNEGLVEYEPVIIKTYRRIIANDF